MMIPAVVLVFLLVTPSLSLPVSTEEFAATGIEGPQAILGDKGFFNPQTTTGEKSQIEGVSHTATGTHQGSFDETSAPKTGVEGIPMGVIQNADKTEYEDYSASGQTVEAVITREHSGTPAQYSDLETTSQAEQKGVQIPPASHQYSENYPQNTPLGKGENVPVNADQNQPFQPENPLLLPIQPLTVVPVNQVGEFLKPVVVPAEAITAGKVIIMAITPIQQRSFQDASTLPEKHFPYQQVIEAVTYGSEQAQAAGFGQPVQKEEIERGETQTPVQPQPNQVPFIKEQVMDNPDVVQQAVELVPNYVPVSAAEPNAQTYGIQPVQPVVNEYVQKQVPSQPTDYTPGQTHPAEDTLPQQQTYVVQQPTEKQGAFQQLGYDTVPHQVQTLYQQQINPVAVGSVQSQQPYQGGQFVQKQTSHPSHQQQSGERQTSYQQSTDQVPVQNQPLVQQVYNVQPESQQSPFPAESQPVKQLSVEQSGYQESYIPVYTYTAEQSQTAYQSGEKQLSSRQPVQSDVHPQEPIQQQVSKVQSFAAVPTESQVPVQPVQPDTIKYVAQQLHETSGEQPNGLIGAQTPQVVNYAEPIYNFGDKVPQNPTVQQSSPFASCQQ